MDLYTEIILDHYKNPQHRGRLENPDASAIEHNPLCGDKIHIDLKFDTKNTLSEIAFSGEGCAISQAATSMLTETLLGKTPEEIIALDNQVVYDLLQVPISPGRVKCALLGLVAAKSAAKIL